MKKSHHKKAKSRLILIVLGVLTLFAARRRFQISNGIDSRESAFGGFDDNY